MSSSTSSTSSASSTSSSSSSHPPASPPSNMPTKSINPSDPNVPLYAKLAGEWACAITAAGMVAPLISIVDKSIVANASGKQPLWEGLKSGVSTLVKRPLYFFKQPAFLLIWGVYGGTYVTANTVEAICNHNKKPWFYPKFVGSSAANVSLSVIKDKIFARMFGVGDPRPLPIRSYFCFGARDSMTILASFNLPYVVSGELQQRFNVSKSSGDTIAQLTIPISMQILSTPLHLYGLDCYNYSNKTSQERISFIRQEYTKTVLARMSRIFPAFGIGGLTNKKLRHHVSDYLSKMYAPTSSRSGASSGSSTTH